MRDLVLQVPYSLNFTSSLVLQFPYSLVFTISLQFPKVSIADPRHFKGGEKISDFRNVTVLVPCEGTRKRLLRMCACGSAVTERTMGMIVPLRTCVCVCVCVCVVQISAHMGTCIVYHMSTPVQARASEQVDENKRESHSKNITIKKKKEKITRISACKSASGRKQGRKS